MVSMSIMAGVYYVFDEIPNKLVPYDYDTFLSNQTEFVIGTTDCQTGQSRYFTRSDYQNDLLQIIRASASLPVVAPIVEYAPYKLLDGGIADPVPILKTQQDGFQKKLSS
ncbi:patatin-like phospholipase family protein [Bacillus sp. 2205SS5-2]|uniref:patatin-like phospholipase family protein n=1 Tax=Bacillus sp. 2205SS5-2 TaxID=3109031 RepID=UPI003004FEAE